MMKINKIEQEIDDIRVNIYEKTKNMSDHEFLNYFKKRGEEAAQKYGFQIARSFASDDDANSSTK